MSIRLASAADCSSPSPSFAPMNDSIVSREAVADRGKLREYFTIAWNSLEGLVGILAGVLAGSISLVGFGIDSLIEVTSGATLLWCM
jgi:hypothetical protein